MARKQTDDLYLFAANTAFDPARATMTVSGLSSIGVAHVYGEQRYVPIEGGTLTDDFGPYAVHVYQIKLS